MSKDEQQAQEACSLLSAMVTVQEFASRQRVLGRLDATTYYAAVEILYKLAKMADGQDEDIKPF